MSRKGAGRAFTFLVAAGVIAMVMILLTLGTSFFAQKQAFDITTEMGGLRTAGQLRLLVSVLAQDIARGNYATVELGIKNVYGKQATFALVLNDRRVAGVDIPEPDVRYDTLLPTYDAGLLRLRLEVKR